MTAAALVGAASAAIALPEAIAAEAAPTVLTLGDIDTGAVAELLASCGLALVRVPAGEAIPGSFWGECEAGLIGCNVYARNDTPVHSILHEAAHLLVMPEARRALVHTDATDSIPEEDAACFLQILLADQLSGVGATRLMADMDAWGYSFRLGSACGWFANDAEDALNFLHSQEAPPWSAAVALPPLAPSPSAD